MPPMTCSVMLFRASWGFGFGIRACFAIGLGTAFFGPGCTAFAGATTLTAGGAFTGSVAGAESPVADTKIAEETSSLAACLVASSRVGPFPCVTASTTGSAASRSCVCRCWNSAKCCLHTCRQSSTESTMNCCTSDSIRAWSSFSTDWERRASASSIAISALHGASLCKVDGSRSAAQFKMTKSTGKTMKYDKQLWDCWAEMGRQRAWLLSCRTARAHACRTSDQSRCVKSEYCYAEAPQSLHSRTIQRHPYFTLPFQGGQENHDPPLRKHRRSWGTSRARPESQFLRFRAPGT